MSVEKTISDNIIDNLPADIAIAVAEAITGAARTLDKALDEAAITGTPEQQAEVDALLSKKSAKSKKTKHCGLTGERPAPGSHMVSEE